MARPKNKDQVILLAAITAFMEKGFADTSIQDIATIAGIGKGTIYDYYQTKDDLFIQALRFQASQVDQLAQDVVANQKSFYDKINSLLDFVLRSETTAHVRMINSFIFNNRVGLNKQTKIEFQELSNSIQNKAINVWRDILIEGVNEGKIRNLDIEFASTCIFNLTSAYNQNMANQDHIQYDQEKEKMLEFILNGIGRQLEASQAINEFKVPEATRNTRIIPHGTSQRR